MAEEARPRHYIFGFGSLISPESRARTGDSGAAHVATISGCERSWSLRVSLPPAAVVNPAIRGVSAVSIRLLPPSSTSSSPSSCAGVLAEVAEAQLPNFDAREIGYKRVSIHLSRVALHGKSTSTSTSTDNNVASCKEVLGAGAVVWCYQDENESADASSSSSLSSFPQLPTAEFPVIQSYVDVILDGCLRVGGEAFVRTFLETTVGWGLQGNNSSSASSGGGGDGSDAASEEDGVGGGLCFVDDRAQPGYVRASEAAAANAATIDAILADYEVVAIGQPDVETVNDGDGGGGGARQWSNALRRKSPDTDPSRLLLSHRKQLPVSSPTLPPS